MCLDTAQQFWSSKTVGSGYLTQLDSGPCVRTLCNNSNPAKMLESGFGTEWTRAHVSIHCQTRSSKNVGIGYLNQLDSGPCVQTLCKNSNPAKMSVSGIWTEWTQAHVSRNCATRSSKNVGIRYLNQLDSGPCVRTLCSNSDQAKCRNRVFEQDRLGPMCLDTVQQC